MILNSYYRSKYDSYIYFKSSDQGEVAYPLFYMDDMLIVSKHKCEKEKLENLLNREFET